MSDVPEMVSFGWNGKSREINVEKNDTRWTTVHIVDGKPDSQLINIFGTHIIPTPFPIDMDRNAVIEELSVRNPNSDVE